MLFRAAHFSSGARGERRVFQKANSRTRGCVKTGRSGSLLQAKPGARLNALPRAGVRAMERAKHRTYSEDEIKARLQSELPHWYFEDGWIRRKYRTEGWKGTLMVVNTVGHLAEAAWHHPDLTVSYAFVIV